MAENDISSVIQKILNPTTPTTQFLRPRLLSVPILGTDTQVVLNETQNKILKEIQRLIIYITIDDCLGVCPSFRKLLLGFLRCQAEIFGFLLT